MTTLTKNKAGNCTDRIDADGDLSNNIEELPEDLLTPEALEELWDESEEGSEATRYIRFAHSVIRSMM